MRWDEVEELKSGGYLIPMFSLLLVSAAVTRALVLITKDGVESPTIARNQWFTRTGLRHVLVDATQGLAWICAALLLFQFSELGFVTNLPISWADLLASFAAISLADFELCGDVRQQRALWRAMAVVICADFIAAFATIDLGSADDCQYLILVLPGVLVACATILWMLFRADAGQHLAGGTT
jgi:hypothetical protein